MRRSKPFLSASVSWSALLLASILSHSALAQTVSDPAKPTDAVVDAKDWPVQRICREIERVANVHDLPLATFTRLIWTESRFDIFARSPAGAQGIAQFMPGTARERGLVDPFDPAQALPASAALLADLKRDLGTFGLAAAAYNAGPARVRGWLAGRRTLPFETRDYLAALTGKQADYFKRKGADVIDFALLPNRTFQQGCEALPVRKTRARLARVTGAGEGPPTPRGVQVAGNFSQDRAMRSWTRIRARLGVAVGDSKPRLYRQRTPRGMKSRWTVRLGANSRKAANALCQRIRDANGFCIVRRNR
ncbi:MAG: transglycosylase SLT domain-containing protein [Pseudomonadota bacterium]